MASLHQSEVVEVAIGPAPGDPWAELDVTLTRPDGTEVTIPAFASNGQWRFRYSSEEVGVHRYVALEGAAAGEFTVVSREPGATGSARGGIRVAPDQRHFERADGSPFLWLGDTWWHGFVTEKITDDEFRELAARRSAEGFSVVQIVVVPPEAGPFDAAVRCRTGWAWEEDFEALNLAWFDDADLRIRTLTDNDLVPCIVGSWNMHLAMMEDRAVLRQWREMVARWAAYPVVWCLGGEPSAAGVPMPAVGPGEPIIYADWVKSMAGHNGPQLARLNQVARYLRGGDGHGRPVTTHCVPSEMPWELMEDENTLDFWMVQTGHGGYPDVVHAVDAVEEAYHHEPTKPVVNGEASYEGIAGASWEDVQRLQFWSHMLSGVAGFTYGAHGLWAMNTDEFPGQMSGRAFHWKEASRFRGGQHVAASARWLRDLPWETLVFRDDLVTPTQRPGERFLPYAGELADGTRVIYLPHFMIESDRILRAVRFENLGGRDWLARVVDIRTGTELPEFTVSPGEDDACPLPGRERPSWEDWVVVLQPAP